MEASIELSTFLIGIFGKKGPITVNTGIAQHNLFLEEDLGEEEYNKLLEEDEIEIGNKAKKINKSDLRAFLETLKSRRNQDVFHNDRTYIFEGITKDEKSGTYWVDWGS